jgi:AcrR family transcriptional regulator
METKNSQGRILECALNLFAEFGYEAVGVNEIAEKSGITKPTLYYFFGSKEGLFTSVLKENYQRLNDQLAEVCVYDPHPNKYERDVFPQLVAIVNTYFAFAIENPVFYRLTLSLSFAPPTSQSAILSQPSHSEQYQMVNSFFSAISSVHHNLRGREDILSTSFIAVINAQIGLWYRGLATLDQDTSAALVKLFMHGIFA